MAIIKPGPAIADIRGSIAGTTFARNSAGLYARQRVAPVQPNTQRQTGVRNAVANLQERFRLTLTQAQRNSWQNLGSLAGGLNAFGDKIRLTGPQAYLRTNVILQIAGATLIDTAPGPPFEIACTVPTHTNVAAAGLTISALTPALVVNELLQLQVSPKLTQGRNFWKGPYTYIYQLNSATVLPFVVYGIGDIAAGDTVFLRYRLVDALGRVSVQDYYRVVMT